MQNIVGLKLFDLVKKEEESIQKRKKLKDQEKITQEIREIMLKEKEQSIDSKREA
jgi:hypothetical protein